MPMKRSHTLKTDPSCFAEVIAGRKRFELRRNDRDFAVGDILRLECCEVLGADELADVSFFDKESGERIAAGGQARRAFEIVEVTSILHGGRYGLPAGHCIMSIVRRDGGEYPAEWGRD